MNQNRTSGFGRHRNFYEWEKESRPDNLELLHTTLKLLFLYRLAEEFRLKTFKKLYTSLP